MSIVTSQTCPLFYAKRDKGMFGNYLIELLGPSYRWLIAGGKYSARPQQVEAFLQNRG